MVGSGPGDPDLLTVAGLRELQSADLVIADRLVSKEILGLVSLCVLLLALFRETSRWVIAIRVQLLPNCQIRGEMASRRVYCHSPPGDFAV